LVCEGPIARKTEGQKLCGRRKCRNEFRCDRERFSSSRYPGAGDVNNPLKNPIKPGLRTGLKPDQPWRKVAGPNITEINLRVPLDPDLVGRLNRFHAALFQREAGRAALFQRDSMPANIVGGYRFPGAPAIIMNATLALIAMNVVGIAAAALISTIAPDLSIPDFLERTVTRPAAEESVS